MKGAWSKEQTYRETRSRAVRHLVRPVGATLGRETVWVSNFKFQKTHLNDNSLLNTHERFPWHKILPHTFVLAYVLLATERVLLKCLSQLSPTCPFCSQYSSLSQCDFFISSSNYRNNFNTVLLKNLHAYSSVLPSSRLIVKKPNSNHITPLLKNLP